VLGENAARHPVARVAGGLQNWRAKEHITMATAAIATLQRPWDCRWSRPGHRLTGVVVALQPEAEWTCVREGHPRDVAEDECATCPHWEADTALALAVDAAVAVHAPVAVDAAAAITSAPRFPVADATRWAYRAVMGSIAVGFAGTGVAILTSPLAIPLTVGLWITAAATVALAAITPAN
jgi:hypothetical protein